MGRTATSTAKAFCPAHVTGFFRPYSSTGSDEEELHTMQDGSTGAGFSLRAGVTTSVTVRERPAGGETHEVSVSGYNPNDTDLSEMLIEYFLEMMGDPPGIKVEAKHEIAVPVGYGLGGSGAAALSLAYALDAALHTNLGREKIGEMAHAVEIECGTGLGDVLASFHGGFEVRTRPGAPGTGRVEKTMADGMAAAIVCFAPISTDRFIRQRLSPRICVLGQTMVEKLQNTKDYDHFQDMSLEFAKEVGVMTPRMRYVADELGDEGLKCGVALFGETLFCIVPSESSSQHRAVQIMNRYRPEGTVIVSELDNGGARILGKER